MILSARQCCKSKYVMWNYDALTHRSRQMRGRAGRKGKDEIGESYLCCEKRDLEEVAQLLEADLPVVESCLTPQKRGVKR